MTTEIDNTAPLELTKKQIRDLKYSRVNITEDTLGDPMVKKPLWMVTSRDRRMLKKARKTPDYFKQVAEKKKSIMEKVLSKLGKK